MNVLVLRLGTGERIGRDRSRCFSCGKTLTWHELVPLLSFLIQKGRCRSCGSQISWQYPIVEFTTGLIFVLTGWHVLGFEFGISNFFRISDFGFLIFGWFYFAAIFSLLLAISVYDFRHKIIPNRFVYPFIALSLISGSLTSVFFTEVRLPEIFAGAGAFFFFASLWFFSKGRWMGLGDAKLALGIGFLLGPWLTIVAVVLSFWIGTLIAVPVVLFWGGGLKTQIPFGPFLALGAFASWVFSDVVLAFFNALLF
ncbi:MAG: leader peptidase (prepilin peptidase) / N-methyltransferase [Parcubacteria group bacterium Gr01-1014_29]|nr:MAG: leader peptidase (prepilin peptidase) / N-methyltransferase [Parcubacteria group bacterium Gr01-1014_29]